MPATFDSMPLRLRAVLLEIEWMGTSADRDLLLDALEHQLRRHLADEARISGSWLDRNPGCPHRRRVATERQYERVELLRRANELRTSGRMFQRHFRAFTYKLATHQVAVEGHGISADVISNVRRPGSTLRLIHDVAAA